MKRNIKIYFLPAVAAAALLSGACSDWTDSESVDIRRPSLEAQNPALYEQYVEALRAYKASEHKLTFVMMENRAGLAPVSQNQRLTSYPDSVDFICMTNPENLAAVYADEMKEVREKGTRVIYDIDYSRFEAEWEALVAAQQPEETPEETTPGETPGDETGDETGSETGEAGDGTGSGEEGGEGEVAPEEPSITFENYCAERIQSLIACCDRYGFDGVTFTYDGPVLSSLSAEQTEELTACLAQIFTALTEWHATHEEKLLFFRGAPCNLPDTSWLAEFSYVIILAESATSGEELSIEVLRSSSAVGLPTDRLMIGVTAPAIDGADEKGFFSQTDEAGDPLSAMVGAAAWVTVPFEYEICGLAISRAWNDYYDLNLVYPNIRKAVNIMNPTSKN